MTYLRGSLEKGNSVRGVNQKVPDAKMESKVTKESLPDAAATPRTVYVVFFSLLLDLLAFTMILPLLPSLLEYYRQHDTEGLYHRLSESIKFFQVAVGAPERYSSVLFGGFLGSMFSFLQFVASPIVGALSDVYGRKRIMIICMIGIALSYLLWAVSSNFAIFVIARFVGGLSKGNISLAMAIITDVSNSKSRGKGMALVGIAFSLGFIVGPMIGAIFSRYSDKSTPDWFWVPAAFAMCLALADILFLAICLQETLPKKKRAKKVLISLSRALEYINPACLFKFDAVKNLSTKDLESLKRLGFIYFIYLFIYSGLEFTVTFLMYHKFSFTSIDQAKVFLTTGVVMALLQGSVVRRLPERLTQKSAVLGLYLIVPSFIIVGLAQTSSMLYLGMIVFAISTAFVVTCMTTLTSKYGNFDQKGTVLGIFRSLGALARALGPIVASMAFWSIGSTITYIVGGILLLYPSLLLQFTVLL
ncbi:major facilitator superfamily domain-containing protein 10 [Lutzomyia longipalpis]|uniref:major facilitator superfamily domain-containing protein 10 n=1 Tax=Lutzomyia longipalpis TaxID=7200 RepID=UPI00248375F4|nr:major facilitator superfamily domain-containing protein 10 [Lutzomyia longipalpis]